MGDSLINSLNLQLNAKTMLKQCKVVVLPTNQKAKGREIIYDGDIFYGQAINDKWFNSNGTQMLRLNNKSDFAYHLYILSDDKIKVGDWAIFPDIKNDVIKNYNLPVKVKYNYASNGLYNFKVIASTNSDLKLPSPSNAFIQKYCEMDGRINEINIEYILQHDLRTDDRKKEFQYIPKVSSDNTITIKAIKNSFSRKEVIKILEELYYISEHPNFEGVDQWFNKNY